MLAAAVARSSRETCYAGSRHRRRSGNMATRSILRSVFTSFAGLKLGTASGRLSVLPRTTNLRELPAFAVQSRGIRQGKSSPGDVSLAAIAANG